MPFLRSRIGPSPLTSLNMNNLTGKQKLDLIRCRIFGTMIGGNYRSGYKNAKKNFTAVARAEYYTLQYANLQNPFAFPIKGKDARRIRKIETYVKKRARGVTIDSKGVKKVSGKKKGRSKSGEDDDRSEKGGRKKGKKGKK